MKASAAALAALLLLALCSPAEASTAVAPLDGVPITCCFTYVQYPVPRGLLASAYTTSSSCSQPAVILVTKKGREMCANPQAHWVQKYLEYLQKEKN